MSLLFEELDYRSTPPGLLSLRRRGELSLGFDVFAAAIGEAGFDPDVPDALLDDRSARVYRPERPVALAAHLKPRGTFGLWSNDKPDETFTDRFSHAFAEAWAEPVTFHNPLQDRPFTQAVYLSRAAIMSNEVA